MVNIQLASEEWVNGQLTGSTGGVTGSTSAINVTYSELNNLINNSLLTIGNQYLITDYQTVHRIPNTTDYNSGTTEPLLVTASGINTLKPEAYSSLYPQDVIYYNYYNDQTMVIGCTKGYIYRRVDTAQNNDIPFDFRNVKFRRWQINVTNVWNSGNTYNKDAVVLSGNTNNIYISLVSGNTSHDTSDVNYWYQFQDIRTNNLYISTTSVSYDLGYNRLVKFPCSNNYIDYHMYSQDYFYTTSFNNIIKKQFLVPMSNEPGYDMISYSNNVIFGSEFNNNSIGSHFYNNNIFFKFDYNIINSFFSDNFIGSSFEKNTIKNDFIFNIVDSYFNLNTIYNGFGYNSIKVRFINNNIESNFYFVDFSKSTYVYSSQIISKELFTNSSGQLKLIYDKVTIVDATA